MAVPPNIRINLLAPFPSLVTGSGPITIGKTNGIWQVGYSVAGLGTQAPPPASTFAGSFVTVFNSITGQYVNVPLATIGSPVLINTLTANNSANLQDVSSFALGFNDYDIAFENVIPVTNNVSFEMQVQQGGSFKVTGYLNSAGAATTYIDLLQATNLGNTAGLGYSGVVRLFNNPSTTTSKLVRGGSTYNTNTGTAAAATVAGWWNGGVGVLTGVQFLMSSGNISSGSIKIYGWI